MQKVAIGAKEVKMCCRQNNKKKFAKGEMLKKNCIPEAGGGTDTADEVRTCGIGVSPCPLCASSVIFTVFAWNHWVGNFILL